jgi:hypothetical protein
MATIHRTEVPEDVTTKWQEALKSVFTKETFKESCRKANQTKNLSFNRAFQTAALHHADPHKFLLPLAKMYKQPASWNNLFMCMHFSVYLASSGLLK